MGRGQHRFWVGLVRFGRLKSCTPGNGRDHQMKGFVFGMAAFLNDVFWRLFARSDLNELGFCRVILTKVHAQPTLAVMNLHHTKLLSMFAMPYFSDTCVKKSTEITSHFVNEIEAQNDSHSTHIFDGKSE